ncbi:hypothetical protein DRJ22_03800 [Candidatus Woesearchaeota archaeon]|nr:MAG: hypothetical protein B6U93_00970 [Candidatus Woesearchaeota archaeon ex4484_78]RLE45681.1 MAG: hypothetical protein DRJ22_03800 [Candidatus Woesearchaeota archaeon]
MAKKPSKRLKPVLPSLKEKKRYLVFEIISKSKIKQAAKLPEIFLKAVKNFIGELGTAGMGFRYLKENYTADMQRGMIRVNHNYVNELKSSLALIKEIERQPAIVKSVGVSGIIKKAKQKYLKEGEK